MCNISENITRKYIDTISVSDYEIETDTGWQKISSVSKTIPYRKYRIGVSSGLFLECADDHILFTESMGEIFAKDLQPNQSLIMTKNGPELVISVDDLVIEENMFDVSVDSPDHRFYTNGILSHNSSALLDSLSFGLFGVPYRNINKPNLVNAINGKDCLVEVEFGIGKKNYLVRRGIKHTVFEIYEDGVLIDQDSKSKDYQKYLEQNILHLNYKSFTQLVVLGSSDYIPFMRLPALERREIIEELLDLKVFSNMNVVVKEKISLFKEQIKEKSSAIVVIKEKIGIQEKHIANLRARNQERIDKNNEEVQANQKIMDDLKSQMDDLNGQIAAKRLEIAALDKLDAKHKSYASLRAKLSDQFEKCNKMISFYRTTGDCPTCTQAISEEVKQKSIEERLTKKLELEKAVGDLDKQIEDTKKTIAAMEKIEQDIHALNVEYQNKNVSMMGVLKYISKLQDENGKILTDSSTTAEEETKLKEYTDEFQKRESEKEALSTDKEYHDLAADLLKDNGIKTKIVRHYLPIMNKYTNKYLTAMDTFINFNLDESFKETIKSRHRDSFEYNSFSQGEKFRIDMSVLLMFRDIARNKNSTNTNILILDEVFDGSLDSNGIEDFMKLLKALSKKIHIFAISHKPDVLADKFDAHIKVEKKNGFSILT